jgi:hypothetical protein
MALSLSCSCGAGFEVEDTFAGQGIACPDCGAPLRVPVLRPPQLRTSGYALASVVVALLGAFTVVGTAVAAALGVVALVSIARHRDRLSGTGYAVLGIVLGTGLTVVTGFAYSRGEIFDQVREQMAGGRVDRDGPMEVVRRKEGYAITRPSPAWGVASPEYAHELKAGDDLLLVGPGREAFLRVIREEVGRMTLDQYRDSFLEGYRDERVAGGKKNFGDLMRYTEFSLRESTRLPPQDGAEAEEVVFDVKLAGQKLTFRARLLKPRGDTHVYAVIAWMTKRRRAQVEPGVRRSLDSFRLLNG